jgi:hypothetical protein
MWKFVCADAAEQRVVVAVSIASIGNFTLGFLSDQGEGRGSFLKKEPKNFSVLVTRLKRQKFFASFFQKRSASLLPNSYKAS